MISNFWQGYIVGTLVAILFVGIPSAFFIGKFTTITESMRWQILATEYQKSSDELIRQVESFRASDICVKPEEKKQLKMVKK